MTLLALVSSVILNTGKKIIFFWEAVCEEQLANVILIFILQYIWSVYVSELLISMNKGVPDWFYL